MRSRTKLGWVSLLVTIAFLAAPGLLSLVSAGSGEVGPSGDTAGGEAANADREVVLYYFHGTRRCNTCRKIESYAQSAVESNFKDKLQAGALRWEVLNTDESVNAHFVDDFGLVSSSLVVVEMKGGDVVRHDVLQEAWTLVRNESRFIEYVQQSVKKYFE